MKVPSHILDDLEEQVAPYDTRVALTDDAAAPLAIIRFYDFDGNGVPERHHTIFLAPSTVEQIGNLIPRLNEPQAALDQTNPEETIAH